ncbi:hypothetical protein [Arthrobacter sp. H14]|uniref:hypothetical protein n=1 Tax=Arthrobacter sp. H14 TaxID=1312959 RepID=UPI00047EF3A9|nr:hypothetical protein [Arthrobacter sp. H14]
MIYKDKVIVVTGGGRDAKGNPLPTVDSGPFPAQVNPVSSSESVKYGAPPLTAYYRMMMGSYGGDLLTPTGQVKWRGRSLSVQGDVEPWIVNGRLHHYEATLRVG